MCGPAMCRLCVLLCAHHWAMLQSSHAPTGGWARGMEDFAPDLETTVGCDLASAGVWPVLLPHPWDFSRQPSPPPHLHGSPALTGAGCRREQVGAPLSVRVWLH